ncbi:MYCBP-associated protein-like isoform X3 [Mizuhopecten yessoensis]|uniref:MYCBP-associated protein-like isoform X3 n=1 Tax=Mizuhopecten yessoensis TaxID=6573 RepID=UPI000B45D3D2|nr:MYCBP-associated protein-like isoform X3 [Mizuhopecten yessoensis]
MGKEDQAGQSRDRRPSRDREHHGSQGHQGSKTHHGHHRDRRMSVASQSGHKLKGKTKPGGTPEKSGTPSAEEEAQSPYRNVIWNEDIEKLQIKEEDLKQVHEQKQRSPGAGQKVNKVTVRKLKPASEWNKPKPKVVTVARPAPPDAPLKPTDVSGFAGPRYDEYGNVIPHSILGNYDDFHKEAVDRGDLLDLPAPRDPGFQTSTPTVKYERKKRVSPTHANESKALDNWQQKMRERKKQQGYISNLLRKNPEDLAMNAADNYRKIQEERYIIDRTIPALDYGKGYRVGSEFWKQQERFGDDISGIHMTLTQSERGYPQPIEHVGIPQGVRNEKGWYWSPNHTAPVHYPWHKAQYLAERKSQLQPIIDELDPHRPEFDSLEVVGTNQPQIKPEREVTELEFTDILEKFPEEDEENLDPLRDHPDVHPEPIFGPSINFAGQPARWTGDGYSFQEQVGIEARVTFEAYAKDRVTSYLYIVNDGTTAVYYDWKKVPKDNPFDLVHQNVQRFYFNNSSGVILPGETMKFPFVFKSPSAGVFHEQWRFETRPTLCGGAALIVTLRGIALQEDKFLKEREELERDLQQKQAEQMVRHLMFDIISGIKTPDRPSSPVDNYITEEEIFARNNPKLHYNFALVQQLKQIYLEMVPEEEREGRIWDLSVEDLKEDLLDMDEDDERKENFLHQLNSNVSKMAYTPHIPIKKNLYKVGYQLLLEAVDKMVGQSMLIRQVMGLPERELTILPEDLSDSRSKSKAENKVKAPPEKGGKAPAKKDEKGAKGKEAAKAEPKGKTPQPPQKKTPSRGPSATPGPGSMMAESRERTMTTPTSTPHSPIPDADPVLYRKYKEKLYTQTTLIMADTLQKMEDVFEEVLCSEDKPPLAL